MLFFPVAFLGISGRNLGSYGFTQVREVGGINFHLVAPQTEVLVTSYVKKPEFLTTIKPTSIKL